MSQLLGWFVDFESRRSLFVAAGALNELRSGLAVAAGSDPVRRISDSFGISNFSESVGDWIKLPGGLIALEFYDPDDFHALGVDSIVGHVSDGVLSLNSPSLSLTTGRRSKSWPIFELPLGDSNLLTSVSDIVDFSKDRLRREKDEQVIWRGQSDYTWPLLAPLFRPRTKTLARDMRLGEYEKRLFQEFKRLSANVFSGRNLPDLQLLTIARHYGLTTRLLDWSTSPLIALFFAVCEPSNDRYDSAIFMRAVSERELLPPEMAESLDIESLSDWQQEFGKAFYPTLLDGRMANQQSVFTIETDWAEVQQQPLDPDPDNVTVQIRLRIPAGETKVQMRNVLRQFGVTWHQVMPDVEGICKHVSGLQF